MIPTSKDDTSDKRVAITMPDVPPPTTRKSKHRLENSSGSRKTEFTSLIYQLTIDLGMSSSRFG
jgi:hypothetical protein